MRTVGIIPARGQSVGIPRKNVHMVRGFPLLAYSILAARAAKSLAGYWVSTDDQEIADVASRWEAAILKRPAALASHDAKTIDVLVDALRQLDARGVAVDAVVTLQPTSPLRDPGLIDQAVALLEAHPVDAVATVTPVSAKVGRVQDSRFIPLYSPDSPRQALEPLYRENGNLYVTRREVLESGRSVLGQRVYPLVLDAVAGLDIDTPEDLALAEVWLERFADRFQFHEVRT